ncbi:caspase, EACC1-associated type [Leptolyngbya sp. AN03gr2]|uniref:caspase, EACC1-associated type n=1 Tax=unclassified Leptolyngbya TaxID=2650499 RepID=UPI003D31129B
MTSKRVALLIGVSEYGDGYDPLPGVVRDVEEMQRVLQERGEFTIEPPLLNPDPQQMREKIDRFFASSASKEDVLLLYFSGHGALDRNAGKDLFLTTCQTRKEQNHLVEATAIEASFLHRHMQNSRSRKIIVILDCCFSGAFANLLKKGDDLVAFERLSVRGSVVLASSSPNEVSYQPKGSAIEERPLSLYTRFLIEGMEGLAQQQKREWIVAQDLHEYAVRKIQTEYAAATPPKIIVAEEEGYRLPIVRAPKADPQIEYRQFVDSLLQELDRDPNFDGEIDPDSLDRDRLEIEREHLGISSEIAAQIEAELQAPFQSRAEKRKRYERSLQMALKNFPFSDRARKQLKEIQERLSLTDADVAAIEARLVPQASQVVELITPPQPIEPETTKAVIAPQYQKLEEYLSKGQWKEADDETYRLMITAVGKEEGDWFAREELLSFPCEVLKAINGLWVKYSNGHFGFSIQKEIYLECGGVLDGQQHQEAWDKFCHANGWKVNNKYVDVAHSTSSPRGHFPTSRWVLGGFVWGWVLFSRIEACKANVRIYKPSKRS